MNRRTFIVGTLAAAAVAAVPSAAEPGDAPQQLLVDGKWVDVRFKDLSEGDFFRTIHPDGAGAPYVVDFVIDQDSLMATPAVVPTGHDTDTGHSEWLTWANDYRGPV